MLNSSVVIPHLLAFLNLASIRSTYILAPYIIALQPLDLYLVFALRK